MDKTYSVALQNNKGIWFTNWNKYYSLDDINWEEVEIFCKERNYRAYGYYYGCNSRVLTSEKCRTVLKEL
jgi:hypothetical protein